MNSSNNLGILTYLRLTMGWESPETGVKNESGS